MIRTFAGSLVCVGIAAATAFGGAHTWDVSEVFSNTDGTIQFVELVEANGTPGEIGLGGKVVSADNTGSSVTLPSNVVGPTSNRHYLIATASFAALPGAPTPDHIIPAGEIPFFDIDGDIVRYGAFDAFNFGAVPIDGTMSMNDGGIVALNSPTNYAGDTGSVDANTSATDGDFDGDGDVDLSDFAQFSLCFGGANVPPAGSCPPGIDADFDDDGDVDLGDFATFSLNFTGPL